MKSKETLGQLIKRLRRSRGMTQEQLAERAGINQGYYAHIENDRRTGSPQNILAIARALGVAPAYKIFAVFDSDASFDAPETKPLKGADILRVPANLTAEDHKLLSSIVNVLEDRRNLEHDFKALEQVDREMEMEAEGTGRQAILEQPDAKQRQKQVG